MDQPQPQYAMPLILIQLTLMRNELSGSASSSLESVSFYPQCIFHFEFEALLHLRGLSQCHDFAGWIFVSHPHHSDSERKRGPTTEYPGPR